ncbi:MAG: zinc-ribbon domain-containing protein [Deltaproteobacteria bacterium]|nr:zinc-ribbon domain-containing protein [Deltaproteobacteria bacterium]
MRCSKCGAENPDRAKICEECASPFTRRCGSCNLRILRARSSALNARGRWRAAGTNRGEYLMRARR